MNSQATAASIVSESFTTSEGYEVTLETGRLAQQANGAVLVRCQDTVLLATATASFRNQYEALQFLALTVHYQEKLYATGRIPSNHTKRQNKRTDDEICVGRLIDRAIRPMFPSTLRCSIDVTVEALSVDPEIHPSTLAVTAASAALMISNLPFDEPIGALRLFQCEQGLSTSLHYKTPKSTKAQVWLAGTSSHISMLEGEADLLEEEALFAILEAGLPLLTPQLEAQRRLQQASHAVNPPYQLADLEEPHPDNQWYPPTEQLEQFAEALFAAGGQRQRREVRQHFFDRWSASDWFQQQGGDLCHKSQTILFESWERALVREQLLTHKRRLDGRTTEELRPISCEAGLLPRTHGSALFTRGETQALVTITLGSHEDEQSSESIFGLNKKHIYLHYNFPSYATGRAGRFGIWNRRDIGHGLLAERALRPAFPERSQFPYAIHIVSEITSANGSTSMATVCGGSLALLCAGVPMSHQVAGTALSLLQEGDVATLITDPTGEEDHHFDMDLKICGTQDRLTAVQMDLKIPGVTIETLREAVTRAGRDRCKVLEQMKACIDQPEELSTHAPHIEHIDIPTQLAKDLLGHGGKKLRRWKELSGAKLSVQTSGKLHVIAPHKESMKRLEVQLNEALEEHIPATPLPPLEEGEVYEGRVTHIAKYGAFVELRPNQTGLVHISELTDEQPVEDVAAHVQAGQKVKVKLISIDKKGRLGLSIKKVPKE